MAIVERQGDSVGRQWVALALLALAVVIVAERSRTYAEPLERDVAGYAVIGHEMLRGRHLYTDLWERKPPLLYGTFSAVEWVVGYGPRDVFTVNVLAAVATLLGCYAAGAAGGSAVAGLTAAAAWTLVGGDLWLEANQPNAEVFVNAALTWAVAVLVRPGGRWKGVSVGALFTLATLYEQHVIVACGTLAVAHVCAAPTEARRRVGQMAVAAAVGAVLWGGLAVYFAAVGRLHAATDVLFHQLFNRYSATDALALGLRWNNLVPRFPIGWALFPISMVALSLIAGRRSSGSTRGERLAVVWIGWAVGTWAVVSLPGRFFPHYYQLWLPPACVASGWAAGRLVGPIGAKVPYLRLGTVAVAVLLLALHQFPQYLLPPERWAALKYPSDNFVEQAYLAHRLDKVLRPDERFWVHGQDTTLYYLSGRSPVTGQLYLEPLNDDPTMAGWNRLRADLDRARPELVLVRDKWGRDLPAESPVMPWVRAHYVPAGTDLTCPSYDFWVLRGKDDLAARLSHPPPAPPFRRFE